MDPVTASIIISAIGQGLNAMGSSDDPAIARMQQENENARQTQRVALSESAMDPFRQQMYQAKDVGRLGLMQQPGNPGVGAPPGRYATTGAPTMRPNTYTPSPELMQWLQMLQQNVAGGQNTPSIVGWGNNSFMNLLDPNAQANPGATGPMPRRLPPPVPGGQPGGPTPGGGNRT